MTTPPPLHEEECFFCWLQALGVDPQLARSIMAAAFAVGAGAGHLGAELGMSHKATADAFTATPVLIFGPAMIATVERQVRAMMTVPMSPDVAAATDGHSHG